MRACTHPIDDNRREFVPHGQILILALGLLSEQISPGLGNAYLPSLSVNFCSKF